ncbi:hypothetical protein MWU75_00445 [Ornithinimicrobium sp. F0845]|uniref:hypothetical protein n=1 Tax=Ornithinimicrobium sp. F0845 TaxID=2926412 RepID=UPI001FF34D96|nr:hypothetical protein [Ornithinimicrobium sp. F0845]MCK0110614.1 hypothetical protein [Ornithinimicrobium sp. F0845]
MPRGVVRRPRCSMPSGRLSLPAAALLAALVSGCAASAPVTVTPARPLESTQAAPTPRDGAVPGPGGEAAGGRGGEETREGRGEKAAVTTDELIALGAELTAALESGDVEQWLALTTLTGEDAQQQRDWFAGVHAVPMDVREMHPTWLLERDVDGPVHGPLVEFSFRHQVTGVDAQPAVELYEFTLERVGTDGPYRIVGVSGSEDLDSAYPQLWDLGPIEVVETEHTVLIAEPDSGIGELSAALDAGAAAVLEAFPVEGVDRMSVTVVDEELVATVYQESDPGTYAGFVVPVPASPVVETGSGLPDVVTGDSIGARLVVDQEYAEDEWGAYDEPAGGSPVMRHEGLHLAMTLRYPDDIPPRWAVEGFASWFEVTGDPEVLASHEDWYRVLTTEDDLPDSLPPSGYEEFFGDLHGEPDEESGDEESIWDEPLEDPWWDSDPDVVELAYLESANVFLYVDATFGPEVTAALGDALHTHDLWLDDDEDLDALVHDHLGVDLDELEGGYVDWVHDTYGR